MTFSIPTAVFGLGLLVHYGASSAIPTQSNPSLSASASSSVTPVVPVQPIVSYIPPTVPKEASVTKIFHFDGAGFENLAIRSNDQILATIAFPEPLLFYIDPLSIRPGIVLHNFTSLKNTLGIAELAPDMFYMSGADADTASYSIYSIDMRHALILSNGTIFTPPVIHKVGSIPSAIAVNGMTYINSGDDFVLCSDSLVGGVWKFNVNTGKSDLIIQDPSMAGPPNMTQYAGFGINGLRVQNHTLYYCNSGAQSFYKMPVSLFNTSEVHF